MSKLTLIDFQKDKEIENKLFDFIEENFGKKRTECFNDVVNFMEDKIIPILCCFYDENEELEDAFNSLKEDCCDVLESIESDLKDIIEFDESNSVVDKLKDLKKVIENHRRSIANADDF